MKKLFYKALCAICALHLTVTSAVAEDDRNPLWDVQNEFAKQGYGLKGPVYSVSRVRKTPVIELGQVVRTDVQPLDSLVFDENGKIAKKYEMQYDNRSSMYTYLPDSVVYTTSGQRYNGPKSNSVVYKRDSSGKISEVKYYDDGKLVARRVFEYIPTGYATVYYYEKKEIGYVKKGNDFIEKGDFVPVSGKLDKEGRVISMTETIPFIGKSTTRYTYNQHGDLVREESNTNLGNKAVGRVVSHETGYKYEYVYDDHGNWTEKRTYKNGKLENNFESREIVYKTPEEIIAEKEAEAERNRLFEEGLRRKGEEYASKFVADKKRIFKESLVSRAESMIRRAVPIVGFGVSDDKFSFDFSDGTQADGIEFEILDKRDFYTGGNDNLISSDMQIVLVPEYTWNKLPKWYVVKYGKLADFDFNPNETTDWVKLYRDKFHSRNDVSDEEIEELWSAELKRQWGDSKYSSIDGYNYYSDSDSDSILVNELVDAYDKGFVSPSVSHKDREKEYIDAYKEYQEKERRRLEDEKRRELCIAAFNACDFDNKGKPMADKLKKYSCKDSDYYFKTNTNTEIINPKFDTELSGSDIQVYLSADKTLALVFESQHTDSYLFIVELDGDNVKSVNYLSPKDTKKFEHPTAIEHKYNR